MYDSAAIRAKKLFSSLKQEVGDCETD